MVASSNGFSPDSTRRTWSRSISSTQCASSTVSDDDVETMSRYSRARYFRSEKIEKPVTTLSSRPRTTKTNSAQVR